jgi:cytochrome c biogenesis protein CcdA
MAAYGIGTGAVLLAAALFSQNALHRWRPRLASSSAWAKKGLGLALGILGILVLTGLDKRLEAWSLGWLPDWSLSL